MVVIVRLVQPSSNKVTDELALIDVGTLSFYERAALSMKVSYSKHSSY